MGTGIDHAVLVVIVRQIIALLPGIKGKLQHLHAGIPGGLQHLLDVRGQEAQILGDEVHFPQLLLHRAEEINARALAPLPVFGGLIPIGNGIIAGKAPEVVDAGHIKELHIVAQPAHPPGILIFLHVLPAVQGVPPQLAVGGKGVRRAARHINGAAVLVQLELLRFRPNIGAVQSHIDGNIPDELHALLVGVFPQGSPLLIKMVLEKDVKIHVLPELFPIPGQRFRPAQADVLVPGNPGAILHLGLDRHIQGVVLQPPAVFLPEFFDGRFLFSPGKGFSEQYKPGVPQGFIIHLFRVVSPVVFQAFLFCQKPLVTEAVQIQKIGVPCKGGKALVGAVPVAGGANGQHLPVGLARLLQKIYKFISAPAQRPNPIGGRQAAHRQ